MQSITSPFLEFLGIPTSKLFLISLHYQEKYEGIFSIEVRGPDCIFGGTSPGKVEMAKHTQTMKIFEICIDFQYFIKFPIRGSVWVQKM